MLFTEQNIIQCSSEHINTSVVTAVRASSACRSRFDADAYNRLQFLRAISHLHLRCSQPRTATATTTTTSSRRRLLRRLQRHRTLLSAAAAADEPAGCCEACLVAPRKGFALVPRRHARFCESCANTVSAIDTVPCAVQTSACSCVSSCRLNTDTCSDRTACWRYTSATSSSFFV